VISSTRIAVVPPQGARYFVSDAHLPDRANERKYSAVARAMGHTYKPEGNMTFIEEFEKCISN